MSNSKQDLIDVIAAEREIERCIKLYCRAIDRRDEALLRSIYHDDAREEHGIYSGSASGFCEWIIGFLNTLGFSAHHISNILIDVDGDKATAESYCVTYSIAVENGADAPFDMVIGGRYLDRFERRDGVWKIAHRQVVYDWNNKSPSDAIWEDELRRQWTRGIAGASDSLYKLIARGS